MRARVAVKRVESEFWKGVTVGMSIVALWVVWLA
jgi:hypothetical protein